MRTILIMCGACLGIGPGSLSPGGLAGMRHRLTNIGLWPSGRALAPRWAPKDGDVLFVAGVDWRYLSQAGLDGLPNPRINLVQGIRHAHAGTELYGYLEKRAVRICVSQEVADAITATDPG